MFHVDHHDTAFDYDDAPDAEWEAYVAFLDAHEFDDFGSMLEAEAIDRAIAATNAMRAAWDRYVQWPA
jgi:hypothetical protein